MLNLTVIWQHVFHQYSIKRNLLITRGINRWYVDNIYHMKLTGYQQLQVNSQKMVMYRIVIYLKIIKTYKKSL